MLTPEELQEVKDILKRRENLKEEIRLKNLTYSQYDMGGLIPLPEELPNLPDNYKEIKDKHFHSSHTCDIEMRVYKNNNKKRTHKSFLTNKYCLTHNVMCSKTGWELGWYGGKNSREIKAVSNGKTVDRKCGGKKIDLEKDYNLIDSKIFKKICIKNT